MNNVIIDKLKNKLNDAIRSRSSDIRIPVEEAGILISEILSLYEKITILQDDIIDLQKNNNDMDIVIQSESLKG